MSLNRTDPIWTDYQQQVKKLVMEKFREEEELESARQIQGLARASVSFKKVPASA